MTRRWQGFGNLNCFVGDDNSPAIMPPVLMSICRSLTSCSHADSVALYRHLTVDVNLLFRSYNSAGSVLRELYYSSRRKYMLSEDNLQSVVTTTSKEYEQHMGGVEYNAWRLLRLVPFKRNYSVKAVKSDLNYRDISFFPAQ